ncbi:MAG: quinolinate synthase NadA [Ignavibacteriales bacterium]|nr:MAG: quinolinate synthase NadA [Ignavibacteriales bacterium]
MRFPIMGNSFQIREEGKMMNEQSVENINRTEEILELKRKKNAVILAHYYQESEIQDVADFIGDSLELSRKAKQTEADIILFAGVHFMAETAKILNPGKKVLIPDLNAGCSLSDATPPPMFKKFREQNPDHLAITYINCSAGVKALSDIICTSSNAVKIVSQIPPDQKILFSPDRNLGKWVIKQTGRDMMLWEGSCIVHETFSHEKLLRLKADAPQAKIIAHPECETGILKEADFIGSTSALLNFIKSDEATEYLIATEPGIIHQMQKSRPEKKFIPVPPEQDCPCNKCPHMKLNTMEKVYLALRDEQPEILLDEEIIRKALIPIERMLEMS